MIEEENITPLDIVIQYPNYLFGYNSLCKDYQKFKNDYKELYDNNIKNLFHYSKEKKQRHLWIVGPPSSGKSYLLNQIIDYLSPKDVFQLPNNNDFSGYIDQEFLYRDEYNYPYLKQPILNSICDGGSQQNTKGSSVILSKYSFVLLLSNSFPFQVYKNELLISATISRFRVFYLNKLNDIPFQLPSMLMVNILNPNLRLGKKCYSYLLNMINFFNKYPKIRFYFPDFQYLEEGDAFLTFDFDEFSNKYNKFMEECKEVYERNDIIFLDPQSEKEAIKMKMENWLYYIYLKYIK